MAKKTEFENLTKEEQKKLSELNLAADLLCVTGMISDEERSKIRDQICKEKNKLTKEYKETDPVKIAFEKWLRASGYDISLTRQKNNNKLYRNLQAQYMWEAYEEGYYKRGEEP